MVVQLGGWMAMPVSMQQDRFRTRDVALTEQSATFCREIPSSKKVAVLK